MRLAEKLPASELRTVAAKLLALAAEKESPRPCEPAAEAEIARDIVALAAETDDWIQTERAAAALRRATEHADTEIQDTVHSIQAACLPVTRDRPLARIGCGARITFARFRKHIAKLIVLVVMGFSPLPFLLSFV